MSWLKLKFCIFTIILARKQITKALIRLHLCAGWSAPLFAYKKVRLLFYRLQKLFQEYHQRPDQDRQNVLPNLGQKSNVLPNLGQKSKLFEKVISRNSSRSNVKTVLMFYF